MGSLRRFLFTFRLLSFTNRSFKTPGTRTSAHRPRELCHETRLHCSTALASRSCLSRTNPVTRSIVSQGLPRDDLEPKLWERWKQPVKPRSDSVFDSRVHGQP